MELLRGLLANSDAARKRLGLPVQDKEGPREGSSGASGRKGAGAVEGVKVEGLGAQGGERALEGEGEEVGGGGVGAREGVGGKAVEGDEGGWRNGTGVAGVGRGRLSGGR